MNHRKLYQNCREEHLAVRRLEHKRLQRLAQPPAMLAAPKQNWRIDFVMDSLATGRRLRVLRILDSCTRERPAIEADGCPGSQRGTRGLHRMIAEGGKPASLGCDNGPEFTSRHFLGWCE